MAKIAVVDDNDEMRKLICDFLAGAGHRAIGCASSRDAVAMILEQKPDLAVLDYMMPGMTGTELLADLRAREQTRLLPVVFLSGTDSVLYARQVPSEPLIRFMTKPVDFERLQGMITDLLSAQ